MKKIRKGILFFATFAILFVFPLDGSEKKFVIKGNSPWPLIDKNGDLTFMYKNKDGGISLATQKMYIEEYSVQNIFPHPYAFSPVIKHNRSGEIWAVWRQENYEGSHIFCGQIRGNQITSYGILSEGKTFNFSPDFAFDSGNTLWVTWIQYLDEKFFVLVKNLESEKIWMINSPFFAGAYDPKICVDRSNNIWVFWVGRDTGRDEIMYSIYDGLQWSPPSKLNKEDMFPHILPDVYLSHEGFPWIVWSGYDGEDYEIFCAYWDGRNWSDEKKITDNKEMDSYPAFSFVLGAIPVIVWSKSFGKGSGIYCKYKYGESWSEEIEIFKSGAESNISPKIAVQNDKIGIIWESDGTIQSKFLYFSELLEKNVWVPEIIGPDIALHSSLDDNKYIGFGDSITYGIIDQQKVPQKGYIPRLEALLDEYYGDSKVINEGLGAETTLDGLGRIDDVLATHLARYLLLMEGTNDVVFMEISMDTTAFNLKQMALKSKNFGMVPLLSTIIPRDDWRWYWRGYYRKRIFNLNGRIRLVAMQLKIPLVDQFKAFFNYPEEEGGWRSLLSNDRIHPNEKGYQLMAETWLEEIKVLPYSPIITDVKRIHDEILFYTKETNSIYWKDNPKLWEEGDFTGYRIYRSEGIGEPYSFDLITILPRELYNTSQKHYSDENIIPARRYSYAISIVRKDGIESPLSEFVND